MTRHHEKSYILYLLQKFHTSINNKEKIVIKFYKKEIDFAEKVDIIGLEAKLEELYYLKSLLDKQLKELNKRIKNENNNEN